MSALPAKKPCSGITEWERQISDARVLLPSENFTPAEKAGLAAYGLRASQSIDLALLGSNAITSEYVAARYPGCDLGSLFDDAELVQRVELISQDAQLQRVAAEMLARRNTTKALEILSERLAAPDVSVSIARDIAELSLKQAATLGQVAPQVRTVTVDSMFHNQVRVTSIFGVTQFNAGGKDDAATVIRATRCATIHEVDAVIQLLRCAGGEITLRGW